MSLPPDPSATGRARVDWRLFGVLTAAGAVGAVAVLPLVFSLQRDVLESAGVALSTLAVAQVAQTTVLVALAALAGLTLGRRSGSVRLSWPGRSTAASGRMAGGRF